MTIDTRQLAAPFEVMVEGVAHMAEVLIDGRTIQSRVAEMSIDLAQHYADLNGEVHVLTILNGAKHFSSDLERGMQVVVPELDMTNDTLKLGSYDGTSSSGVVRQCSKLNIPIEGRDVLVVEDIFDTGNTLRWLISYLEGQKPRSVEVAALLDKEVPDKIPNALGSVPLHTGFRIPGQFVIGYGLDYVEHYRNLSDIYALQPL